MLFADRWCRFSRMVGLGCNADRLNAQCLPRKLLTWSKWDISLLDVGLRRQIQNKNDMDIPLTIILASCFWKVVAHCSGVLRQRDNVTTAGSCHSVILSSGEKDCLGGLNSRSHWFPTITIDEAATHFLQRTLLLQYDSSWTIQRSQFLLNELLSNYTTGRLNDEFSKRCKA